MSETPREMSAQARNTLERANRAETAAMGFLGVGGLLLAIGTVLAVTTGLGIVGIVLLLFGGIALLVGCIENVRAEVLHVRAKIERD